MKISLLLYHISFLGLLAELLGSVIWGRFGWVTWLRVPPEVAFRQALELGPGGGWERAPGGASCLLSPQPWGSGPALGFITGARGFRGLTSAHRGRRGSIFTFPGFQCILKKGVNSHQTAFLFRPFVKVSRARADSTLDFFFFSWCCYIFLDTQ